MLTQEVLSLVRLPVPPRPQPEKPKCFRPFPAYGRAGSLSISGKEGRTAPHGGRESPEYTPKDVAGAF